MADQKEKKQVLKFIKKIEKKYLAWGQRLIDSPYGGQAHRKPFDFLLLFSGIAVEAKYMDGGLTFNLAEWRRERPNQEIGLIQFFNQTHCPAILLIFWKPKCKEQPKNRIQIRWEYIQSLQGKEKIKLLEMREQADLEEIMFNNGVIEK